MTIKSFAAAIDIKAGTIVKFTTDGKITPATVATDKLVGVNVLDVKAEEQASVELNDVVTIIYGGTVNAGDALTSNANGNAVTATTGNTIIAYALESAASGDYKQAVIR